MAEEERGTRMGRLAQITQVASSISVVIGIVVAVITMFSTIRNANVALTGTRLSTLATLKEFIDNDDKIRVKAERFLASENNNQAKLDELIKKKGSGENAYDSDELKDLREVAHHYETLATLVKRDYIDFDLVFDTIPFPDKFWEATREFRLELRTRNWSDGKGLEDFLIDSEYLKKRYDEARLKALHKNSWFWK
jgi:hypothetical protein